MTTLTLALDWTPNTNHTGFFVAREAGFYAEAGLHVNLLSPHEDNYARTPAKKLEQGDADLAIAPSESILSYRAKAQPTYFTAVAALLHADTSAIVTLASSGAGNGADNDIQRPAHLDGKTYASYHARYEDAIVRQMIRNDGGTGDLIIHYPEKLGIWSTLLSGQADATWIFRAWEGIEAETQGVNLHVFRLEHYGIPYGYSPLLLAREPDLSERAEVLQAFLAASERGFRLAQDDPHRAVDYLRPFVPERDRERIDLLASQRYLNPLYTNAAGAWGVMDAGVWQRFLAWLYEQSLLTTSVVASDVFSNVLLEH